MALRKNQKQTVGWTCAVLMSAFLSACSGQEDSPPDGSDPGALPAEIPVTVVADLTGPFAANGLRYAQGVRVAIDEINDSTLLGDSKLVTTERDSASTVATAVSEVSRAVQTDTVAILGVGSSPLALASAPIAQQAKVPLLANVNPPGLVDVGDYVYVMQRSLINEEMAQPLVDHIRATSKNVTIIFANDNVGEVAFTDLMTSLLEDAGVEIDQKLGTPIAATDFSALATRATSTSPDAIVINSGGSGVLSLVQALRSAGFDGQLYGQSGVADPLIDAGAVAEGMITPIHWIPAVDNAQTQDFMTRMTEAYPDAPVSYATVDGYDATHFLALAIKEAGSIQRSDVLAGLQTVANAGFDGPPGNLTFHGPGNREISTPVVLAEYQDGEFRVAPTP